MTAPVPRARRWPRRLLAVALAVLGALVLSEAVLRYLLFAESALASRFGEALRAPARFADRHDSAYWKLRYRLESWDRAGPSADYDPELGWVAPLVDAETHTHADLELLAGRRPVVLHGDSFAHCLTGEGDCWQGLLDRSALGERAFLLNHGAAGYGLGQIYLSYARSMEAYAALDPIVVIGILVDDDLDRGLLEFRRGPKPRLRVDDEGDLVIPPEPVPADPKAWIEAEGTGIRSYLAALVARAWQRRSARAEDGEDSDHAGDVRRLTRAILERLAADLEARGLTGLVWLFSAQERSAPSRQPGWRERFLVAELERLGLPYALSREALAERLAGGGAALGDFFLPDGHFDARGNAAVFPQLLERVADALDAARPAPPSASTEPLAAALARSRLRLPGAVVEELVVGGDGGRIQAVNGPMPRLDALGAQRRFVLLPGPEGAASITWRLLRPARRFSARLGRLQLTGDREDAGEMSFGLFLDGREARRIELPAGAPAIDVELDLEGVERWGLALEGAPGQTACLAAPVVRPLEGGR